MLKNQKRREAKYPKSFNAVRKAQKEIRELTGHLKAGTLHGKRLQSGLKRIQEHLKKGLCHDDFGRDDDNGP
jgi:signal transduction histidine kinase